MEKLPKKSCKKSLFDTFLEEINKEELESDLSSNETSIEETIMMDVENSPINNQDTILNENNNCDIMVKYFLKTIIKLNINIIFDFIIA